MFLTDRVPMPKVRRTIDGYLVADVKVARTGVQEYLGSELGRPDMPIVRLYRSPEEVFADESMSTYAHRPVTNDHPSEMVGADNWKRLSIGQTGGEVGQEGKFIRVPLVLMDSAGIKSFETGKRELSMGYTAEIVFKDGTSPEGEHYDAIQTNIRMNHLALVDKARGGAELRIGDQHADPESAFHAQRDDANQRLLDHSRQQADAVAAHAARFTAEYAARDHALTRNGYDASLDFTPTAPAPID